MKSSKQVNLFSASFLPPLHENLGISPAVPLLLRISIRKQAVKLQVLSNEKLKLFLCSVLLQDHLSLDPQRDKLCSFTLFCSMYKATGMSMDEHPLQKKKKKITLRNSILLGVVNNKHIDQENTEIHKGKKRGM